MSPRVQPMRGPTRAAIRLGFRPGDELTMGGEPCRHVLETAVGHILGRGDVPGSYLPVDHPDMWRRRFEPGFIYLPGPRDAAGARGTAVTDATPGRVQPSGGRRPRRPRHRPSSGWEARVDGRSDRGNPGAGGRTAVDGTASGAVPQTRDVSDASCASVDAGVRP